MSARRTKRRYAHELYPHPDEGQVRPLATEVPYLYARAMGFSTQGTGWHDLFDSGDYATASARTHEYILAAEVAFLADALHQGLTGDEAWTWVMERVGYGDSIGEWVWQRAEHHGVDPHRIKPYPCGPTPDHHDHMASTGDVMGSGLVTTVLMPEDECETCTEPVDEEPA